MKLLFFASDYQIGLTFLLTEELKYLIRQPGLQILAIAGDTEQLKGLTQQLEYHNIPIKRITGLDFHKNFFSLAKQIHAILKVSKCTHIHVQNNWQLSLLVFIKYFYRYNCKIFYTIHSYRNNSFIKAIIAKIIIELALFLYTDKVFVPSSEMKQKFWLVRKKTFILYLGVEERFFSIPSPIFSDSYKNIIFAGQFRKGKNQTTIIKALSNYIQKTGKRDFTLYLPGEGSLKNNCIKLVNDLKLQNKILFPGQLSREEMLNLYKRCQVAIVPTNSETFGHCIAEPFVMGLCVMSRKVGIAKDIIVDGENGLLFNNQNDLTLLLIKYLNNNIAIEEMGKLAQEGRELFRWSSICKRYEEIMVGDID
ncbi:MAG: glycosyltransferase family 4 protein [Mariniphaga sp.]